MISNAICRLFENLSINTWERIRLGEQWDIRQNETTISDILFLEIAIHDSPNVHVFKTSQSEEKDKGTDWEFWVGKQGIGWLRYAIQAKRLDTSNNKYNQLAHKVNTKLQADILKEFAEKNQAIPLYCFYNYIVLPDYSSFWHCHGNPVETQLGCTITPLSVVRNVLPRNQAKNRTFEYIHNNKCTHPWKCLVCCPKFTSILSSKDRTASKKKLNEFFGVEIQIYDAPPDILLPTDVELLPLNIERLGYEFYQDDETLGLPRRIVTIRLP